MEANFDRLRTQAMNIVAIPQHYRLVMEDSTPTRDAVNRSFIWEDPENREWTLEISLDLATGCLVDLNVDLEPNEETNDREDPKGMGEEAREIADAFVGKHAPDAAGLTWIHTDDSRRRITYREEVGGLPLPDTGCEVTLDQGLGIIRYRHHLKSAPTPEWPAVLVNEGAVKEQLLCHTHMELQITAFSPSIYDVPGTEDEYRMVYNPAPLMRFIDAVSGRDCFGPEHYALPSIHSLKVDEGPTETAGSGPEEAKTGANRSIADWQQLLGINPELYELEKSSDDGERIMLQYRHIDELEDEPEQAALSVDGYMKYRWGDKLRNLESPFKLQIEKTTGTLLRFHRNDPGKEQPLSPLNRQQCWVKAEGFLREVFPDYASYLRLEVDKDDLEDEPRSREFFFLPVYIGEIPVNGERVTISISTATGNTCLYSGVSCEMLQQLAEPRLAPLLTPEIALEIYKRYMDVKLRWIKDSNAVRPVYRLIYELVTIPRSEPSSGFVNCKLRYIDARSGEPIWGKY
ncbi:hypothetical protein H70357_16685 [Paenibacillus sp. FSL H7-0357]|uniref:YcdB/YcdC domain-containing protein n=1 Tax=Paenibacillus sp. FSL H7-0357 TaxID=1536774 RepID=UPI0004F7BA09|nr:YcdB/YcdC domain-containing protein [Paenibacillus sp. FSL H7-0357]AIQ18136.1 hypothetical protein H70357_16685 [Paenibacillus sp. FSL H7-0357]